MFGLIMGIVVLALLISVILIYILGVKSTNTNPGINNKEEKADTNYIRISLISPDHFRASERVSEDLAQFLKNGNRDRELIEFLQDNVNGIDAFDKYIGVVGKYNPRLTMLMLMDLIQVVNGLGINIETPHSDLLPIYMFMVRLTEPNRDDMSLFYNADKWDEVVPKIVSMITTISGFRDKSLGKDDLYLGKVLEVAFEDKSETYRNLLSRLCSIISKCSEAESEEHHILLRSSDKQNNIEQAQVSEEGEQNTLTTLDNLIGLEVVKSEVKKLSQFIKVQSLREEKGLKCSPISYHCLFVGNPGTGKTTVARILATIYKDLGVLKKGHLVETDRSGLVGEYVGQTAVKTNKIIDSALDGVLFIDEAYTLVQGDHNDFGNEAIATLLKRMEDDRDRLVVILAGYENEMERFITSNPGLKSRFNRFLHFENYCAEELIKIFELNAEKYNYLISDDAKTKLKELISMAVNSSDNNWGNARYARNLFEKTIENQAARLSILSDITEKSLRIIMSEDIPSSIK